MNKININVVQLQT